MQYKRSYRFRVIMAIIALVLINSIAGALYQRFDLTRNNRYTVSEASKTIVKQLNFPVYIDVLLGGNIPSEFRRLRAETRHMLKEFRTVNPEITFNFADPLEDEAPGTDVVTQLQQLGLTPTTVTREEGSRVSQELIFPWALVNSGEQTIRVPLLKNRLGASVEERITNSVQALEYAFTDAFVKLGTENKKNIAVLKGNGELQDIYIADFLTTIGAYYNIAPFTLDSVAASPQKTLNALKTFDLVLVAKPTEAFTDEEKYVLDQYLLNGGKLLWLIDQVAIEIEDLYNEDGNAIAIPRNLNLNDMFFKYNIRINPVLVNDLYVTQIVLAAGTGNNTQYSPVPWPYAPMVFPENDHPVSTNTEALRFRFANAIDTLEGTVKKTILLRSSPLSKPVGVPSQISLDIVKKEPDRSTYNNGSMPLAVLLEGRFTSVFKNRVKPFALPDAKDEGTPAAMIVVADGDLIKNDIRNGQPLELGYDKWTNNFYGNKEFLLNSINYLLDDTGVVAIRGKKLTLAFLDKERVNNQKIVWQLITIGGPLVVLLLFGGLFYKLRRVKYAR